MEVFAVDVVEQDYQEEDSLYDKLVKFCSHYDEIGVRKIYDPANSNNDIMNIHSSIEFQIIRDKIKKLYEALLTNDEITILNCINGKQYDLDVAYAKDAKSHSRALNLKENGGFINLTCVDDENRNIYSNQTLPKDLSINFYVGFPSSISASNVTLVVSNSGYESINCKRGNEETTKKINGKYYRNESTCYNGNHYVQAIVKTTTGNKYYSRPFIVKIRDYE